MKNLLQHLKKERSQYFSIALLLLILLIPNIYLLTKSPDFEAAPLVKAIAFVIASFTFLVLHLSYLRPKIFFLICVLVLLLQPVEIVTIYLYQSSITTGILSLIIDTNFSEATELVMGLWPFVILFLAIIALYLFVVIKYLRSSFKLPVKLKWGIFLSSIAVYLFLLAWEFRLDSKFINPDSSRKENLSNAYENVKLKFYKIFPYNFYFHTKITIDNRVAINKASKLLKNFSFGATKKDNLDQIENYVFIIGETARAHNWQLYGYARETNAYTKNITNMLVMQQCYTSADMTSLSIPLLLTGVEPDSFANAYKQKTFIKAFKEAGFKSYWLSNQAIFDSRISVLTTDVDSFINLNLKSENQVNFDSVVFRPLESIIKSAAKKRLIVINLMGSHFRYNFRYPDNFKKYTPAMEGAFDYSLINASNKEKLINAYDNSILYTDYVLSEIINILNRDSEQLSLLTYISDHGENLYDTKEELFAHCTENPNHFELKVPLMIWYSNKYKTIYANKVENIIYNASKPISSNVIFQSIIDAANINFKNEKPEKSIFRKSLQSDSIIKVLVPSGNIFEYKINY